MSDLGKQRFYMGKLCDQYCILDRQSDDPKYRLKTQSGKIVVFPKIIETLPARNQTNLRKMKQRLKEIRKAENDKRKKGESHF